MSTMENGFCIRVKRTRNRCPIGERTGAGNRAESKIPVLSCEGACIRGEIARLAANMVAREEPYARGCHGELFSVPDSQMAEWIREADKVVLIDGCFLRCHGRMFESLSGKGKLHQFDALAVYKKYTDVFEIDAVPEEERKKVARQVADSVLAAMAKEE